MIKNHKREQRQIHNNYRIKTEKDETPNPFNINPQFHVNTEDVAVNIRRARTTEIRSNSEIAAAVGDRAAEKAPKALPTADRVGGKIIYIDGGVLKGAEAKEQEHQNKKEKKKPISSCRHVDK